MKTSPLLRFTEDIAVEPITKIRPLKHDLPVIENKPVNNTQSISEIQQQHTRQPRVSILMPIRNEGKYIQQSLEAVLAQNYPADLVEILIADGMSTDDTIAQIQLLPDAQRIRIIQNVQHIQARGLNQLIREATGDILIRVDGHTVINPNYIQCCVAALQESGAQAVGGAIAPQGTTPLGSAIAAATRSPFAVPGAFHTAQKPQFTDTVYMGAWPKEIFADLGGFAEDLRANEDYELNYRIRQRGGTIYFDPSIRSKYFGRQTLGALARQYFIYGQSKTMMLRRHSSSLRWRQLIAPLFVAALFFGAPGGFFNHTLAFIWLTMIVLYGILSLLFTARIAHYCQYTTKYRIPIIFLLLHISWGLGFWFGWIPKRNTKML